MKGGFTQRELDAMVRSLPSSPPTGRAMTPEQKRAAVERLLAAWEARPDLRLGQLVHHALRSEAPLAWLQSVEDADLVAILEAYAGRRA